MKKIFIACIFVLALIERVWFDLGPNIELVTLASILAAFYVDKKASVFMTLGVIILSDLLIGNSNIFIFTWSGIIIPLFFVNLFKNLKINRIGSATVMGITSNLFFYFWTNFGVWALDSWGMYPNTAIGLLHSFVNGLPFLKYQLTSTLFFVPTGFILYEIIFNNLLNKLKKPSALTSFIVKNG